MKVIMLFKGLLVVFSFAFISAQQTIIVSEEIDVKKGDLLSINIEHSALDLVVWDKNEILYEVYYEGKLSSEEKEELLNRWEHGISKSGKEVEVVLKFDSSRNNLNGDSFFNPQFVNVEIKEILSGVSDVIGSINWDKIDFPQFDFQEWSDGDGEEYINKWKEEFDKSDMDELFNNVSFDFGEVDFSNLKEGILVLRDSLKSHFRKEFKVNSEGDTIHSFIYESSKPQRANIKTMGAKKNSYGKKKEVRLRLRIPKYLIIKLNSDFSDVKLPEIDSKILANINYGKVEAASLNNANNRIEFSFSNIDIGKLSADVLKISHARNANIDKMIEGDLNVSFSNLTIGELKNSLELKISHSSVEIEDIDRDFEELDVNSQFSSCKIVLPNVAFNFSYESMFSEKLDMSNFNDPENIFRDVKRNLERFHGFYKSEDTSRKVNFDVNHSEIKLDVN